MNKKYVKIIVYTGIFSIAYGGFFYQRYTSNPAIATSITTPIINTASSTQNSFRTGYTSEIISTEIHDDTEIQYDENDKSAALRKKPALNNKRTLTAKLKTDSVSGSALEKNIYPEPSSFSEQIEYSPQTQNIKPASLAFTPATNTGSTRSSLITENISSPATTDSTSTNTENGTVDTTTSTADLNVAESDGAEFLPDGSSQQDLFTAQSKEPRVYTVKDYQAADISCTPGYGDSSPHAVLMRGLKGC